MGIAVVPLHENIPIDNFTRDLTSHVGTLGSVTCLTRQGVNRAFGINSVTRDLPNLPLWYYINNLDTRYDFVIFQCEAQSSE